MTKPSLKLSGAEPGQKKWSNDKKNISQTDPGSTHSYPSSNTPNRPRNLLITDATQPFHFSFERCGVLTTITIRQRPDETTWPGGALWDLGVLLSQVLVRLTQCASKPTTKPTQRPFSQKLQPTISTKIKKKTNILTPSSTPYLTTVAAPGALPSRLHQVLSDRKWNETRVLELGCGVGLTGLVAAMLGAKLVLLTDLDVVIEQVTAPNVHANTTGSPPIEARLPTSLLVNCINHRTIKATGCHVIAMPLCWGNAKDEGNVRKVLEHFSDRPQSTKSSTNPKAVHRAGLTETLNCPLASILPNLILIGDVAYQHKPGAPSHFEALRSTLLKFVDDNTVVLFGTRLRMPASADLLDLFLEELEEIVTPPIGAEEIDSIFANQKHNMTIHVMKKKKKSLELDDESKR
jgi:predicted nicotinamide N-methyase